MQISKVNCVKYSYLRPNFKSASNPVASKANDNNENRITKTSKVICSLSAIAALALVAYYFTHHNAKDAKKVVNETKKTKNELFVTKKERNNSIIENCTKEKITNIVKHQKNGENVKNIVYFDKNGDCISKYYQPDGKTLKSFDTISKDKRQLSTVEFYKNGKIPKHMTIINNKKTTEIFYSKEGKVKKIIDK